MEGHFRSLYSCLGCRVAGPGHQRTDRARGRQQRQAHLWEFHMANPHNSTSGVHKLLAPVGWRCPGVPVDKFKLIIWIEITVTCTYSVVNSRVVTSNPADGRCVIKKI